MVKHKLNHSGLQLNPRYFFLWFTEVFYPIKLQKLADLDLGITDLLPFWSKDNQANFRHLTNITEIV